MVRYVSSVPPRRPTRGRSVHLDSITESARVGEHGLSEVFG